MCDYSNYIAFVKHICQNNSLDFKQHPLYTEILEHVSFNNGLDYLHLLQTCTDLDIDDIIKFCTLNDAIGNPKKYNYGIVDCSPTSLRYIWYAYQILKYMSTFSQNEAFQLVEIGGGYGGLALAISFFSSKMNIKIDRYNIIDLHWPSHLQRMYLAKHTLNFTVEYYDAEKHGADISGKNLFAISTYCFSEIDKTNQVKYIDNLFPKVSHGYFAWNMIPVYNFGFNYIEEDEVPKTGEYNKIIKF